MKKFLKAVLPVILISTCCTGKKAESREFFREPVKIEIAENSTIVCFGDSLTYGHGCDFATESWPALLQKRVCIPVINSGVNDNTTADAVLRYKTDVLDHNPAIVIFDFGGNDLFLPSKKLSYKKIEENFRFMLNQIDFEKTHVYIMRFYNNQMRFLDVFGSFDRMLKRLEKDYGVEIIWDAWKGAWGKPDCKYDMTHCNAKGYRIMEENIFEVIEPLLEANALLKTEE